MQPVTLDDWLAHAERQHSVGIDMGLARVGEVARRMGLRPPDHAPAPRSLIVAGTNGKGSTTTFAEALLIAAGRRTGATLSPHVHRFNERIRLDGQAVDDAMLCQAFAAVEAARREVPLTYFEYSALGAFSVFRGAAVEVAVLEIGLGGRLDAFNLVGADVAVITSIGLDHQAFLGDDLEQIGREKAGVMRPGRPVVIGADVTRSVGEEARRLGCPTKVMGTTFQLRVEADCWHFDGAAGSFSDLPWGWLAPYNCALAIEAVGLLEPLTGDRVRQALRTARLPGRCEAWQLQGRQVLIDVAHNPAGARFLRDLVAIRYPGRRIVALLGMLTDKDAAGVAAAMAGAVDTWVCVPTTVLRGQSGAALAERLQLALVDSPGGAPDIRVGADMSAGLAQTLACSAPGDVILAFGSFSVVEALRDLLALDEQAATGSISGG